MEFLVQEILQVNIASQDSDTDDDFLAQIGSDSDILEKVEKADFSNSWTTIGQHWLGLKVIYVFQLASAKFHCRTNVC